MISGSRTSLWDGCNSELVRGIFAPSCFFFSRPRITAPFLLALFCRRPPGFGCNSSAASFFCSRKTLFFFGIGLSPPPPWGTFPLRTTMCWSFSMVPFISLLPFASFFPRRVVEQPIFSLPLGLMRVLPFLVAQLRAYFPPLCKKAFFALFMRP